MSPKFINEERLAATLNKNNHDQTLPVIHGERASLEPFPAQKSLIGKAIFIKGDLVSREDLFIDGRLEGSISLKNNKLEIGKNGYLESNAFAKVIIINGELKGDAYASDQIVVTKTARINGNIFASDVTIEDGAFINGSIEMKKQDFSRVPEVFDANAKNAAAGASYNSLGDRMLEITHFYSSRQQNTFDAQNSELQKRTRELSAFAADMQPDAEFPFGEKSVIGETVMIRGELVAEEDVIIQGKIDGIIYFKNNRLEVDCNAQLKANTFVKSMVLYGEINGDVCASEHVLIKKSGHILGKIRSPRFTLESGGILMGGIEMEQQNIDKVFSDIMSSINEMAIFTKRPEAKENTGKVENTKKLTTVEKNIGLG